MVKRYFAVIFLIIACSLIANETPFFSGNIDKATDVPKGKLSNTLSDIGEFDYALLIGADGTAAYIQKKAFPLLKIKKSWGKWKVKAKDLPEVCNIVNLAEIALFKKDSNYGLTIWDNNQIMPEITPFQARLLEFELLGKSSKNDYKARKYKEKDQYYSTLKTDSFLRLHDRGMEEEYPIEKLSVKDFYFACDDDTLEHIWINYPEDDLDLLINSIHQTKKPVCVFHVIGMTEEQWNETINNTDDLAFSTSSKPLRLTYPESSPTTGNNFRMAGKFSQLYSLLSKADNASKLYLTTSETTSSTAMRSALNEAEKNQTGILFACLEMDPNLRKSKQDNRLRNFGYIVESLIKKWDGPIYFIGTPDYELPYFKDDKAIDDFFGFWDKIK